MNLVRRFGILALGVVVAVLAAWEFVWSLVTETSVTFGWTAVAPLSSSTYSPSPESLPIALGLFAIAAALIGGWIGVRFGRRTPNASALRRFLPAGIGILVLVVIALSVVVAPRSSESNLGTTEYSGETFVNFDPPQIVLGNTIGVAILVLAVGAIAWWVGEQIGRRAEAVSRPSQA